jgi:CheY-like chemotaxis protein
MNRCSVDIQIVGSEPISRHQFPSNFEKKRKAVIDSANACGVAERTSEGNFDVCLMDMSSLGKGELTLIRKLCAKSNVGIIRVTAKNNQITRIGGLTFLHKKLTTSLIFVAAQVPHSQTSWEFDLLKRLRNSATTLQALSGTLSALELMLTSKKTEQ